MNPERVYCVTILLNIDKWQNCVNAASVRFTTAIIFIGDSRMTNDSKWRSPSGHPISSHATDKLLAVSGTTDDEINITANLTRDGDWLSGKLTIEANKDRLPAVSGMGVTAEVTKTPENVSSADLSNAQLLSEAIKVIDSYYEAFGDIYIKDMGQYRARDFLAKMR
jgi:hypothetical protein